MADLPPMIRQLSRRALFAHCTWVSLMAASPMLAGEASLSASQEGQADAASQPAGAAWLVLPDRPLGRLWASVDGSTEPWVPESQARPTADRWASWADGIAALGAAGPARREALAQLARIAADDGRATDGFHWVSALSAGDPEALAGTLPRLFPGVPMSVALGPGGVPAAMPDGSVLRPCIPPVDGAPAARVPPRRAEARDLQIGDATFDLVLKVDGSGVVCEATHTGGGEATLRLALPALDGWRLRSLYVDWEQQPLPNGPDGQPADRDTFDWAGSVIDVPLRPTEGENGAPAEPEPYSIFVRIAPSRLPLPKTPEGGLPASLAQHGLELVVPAKDSGRAGAAEPWPAIAAAWAQASGLPTKVREAQGGTPPGVLPGGAAEEVRGMTLRFHEVPDPVALRRRITSAIEAQARAAL